MRSIIKSEAILKTKDGRELICHVPVYSVNTEWATSKWATSNRTIGGLIEFNILPSSIDIEGATVDCFSYYSDQTIHHVRFTDVLVLQNDSDKQCTFVAKDIIEENYFRKIVINEESENDLIDGLISNLEPGLVI